MRPSALRHPVAVLRTIIGKTQSEFADMVGCSLPTINSIEGLRRLDLSAKLAARISQVTGVDAGWLLAGDPTKEPLDIIGQPFTASTHAASQVRAIDEHALRFLAAQRDMPHLNHRGTEPLIMQTTAAGHRIENLTREFDRTWDLETWKENEARRATLEIKGCLMRLNSIHGA